MSNKTIANIGGLVILFACASALLLSCSKATSGVRYSVNASELSSDYGKPVVIGRIESAEITESSGIAASQCQPGVLWTHNDSGDNAFAFAMDEKGKHLGTWLVANAKNLDWEDMATYKDASGVCYLYFGDIGNNELERPDQRVYRVKEPTVTPNAAASSRKSPLPTQPADILTFKYSDKPHNAETLLVQPKTGEIYVLTKRADGPSDVFKIAPSFGSTSPIPAQLVAEISLPTIPSGLLTGGAISADGKQAVVCDYSAAYVFDLNGSANFDDIWKQKPVQVDIGDRKQGEAVTFTPDGKAIIATSEKINSPLIEVTRK